MDKSTKKPQVFRLECPCCQAEIWIDPVAKEALKFEKAKKKKGSLDELLMKEKKKKNEVDRRFVATAELAKERHKKAKEKFEKAFSNLEED
jgi:hypothetical protein